MKSTGRFTPTLRKLTHYQYDKCSGCGAQLKKGVPAYAGYTQDNTPVYVGECCKADIAELASHIYWWWTTYKRPEPKTPLWRFMDFAKFVSILKDKALYFARVDTLGDPFEGARGIATREAEWKKHCMDYFRESIRTIPGGPSAEMLANIDAEADRLYAEFVQSGERQLHGTYASCWYSNDAESEAIWRLYCPPKTAGVAIRTHFSMLDTALDPHADVKFGHVQYVDFSKNFAGTYDRVFWKRKSLMHEAEVRGVIQKPLDSKTDELGILVPVDLHNLMQRVVVSPFAPPWFEDVLRETMERYGVTTPVTASELSAQPFF